MISAYEWYDLQLIITCIVDGQYVVIASAFHGLADVVNAIRDHVNGGEIRSPIVWLSCLAVAESDYGYMIDNDLVTLVV